jgi:dihydroxy-acid dehydratase
MTDGIEGGLTSYGDPAFSSFIRRAFLASAGYDDTDLSRPIVGIADTTSDYVPCHRQMPELVRAVSRGVTEAGGIPFVFPTMALGEILLSPTSMLFRNLMAMETEELIAAQPMDSVVLLGGCDKTVPAQLMAAISSDRPFLSVVAGPMGTGSFRGERLGACTDCRRIWASGRAGDVSGDDVRQAREALVSTAGTCTVMGTASTMACLTEALGLMLPGGAAAPASTGARLRHAVASGRRAVRLAKDGVRPSYILSKASFRNASRVLLAIGGSTNAVIHLVAIARRAAIDLTIDEVVAERDEIPLLVDVKPSGAGYMPDFFNAGGVPVLLHELRELLEGDALTVSGKTIGEIAAESPGASQWQATIGTLTAPIGEPGALTVLRGNLAPDGAVIKVSAASSRLLTHVGKAIVFESPEDVEHRLESLDISPDDVLVLRNIGPTGAGMPEAGSIPIPRALSRQGITDIVRISDGRMSGTAYGTVVLHVSPESAVGGPLALVRDGDLIELDALAGRLWLHVHEAELNRRRQAWKPPQIPGRGWRRLYAERIQQAHLGADMDFLTPARE